MLIVSDIGKVYIVGNDNSCNTKSGAKIHAEIKAHQKIISDLKSAIDIIGKDRYKIPYIILSDRLIEENNLLTKLTSTEYVCKDQINP